MTSLNSYAPRFLYTGGAYDAIIGMYTDGAREENPVDGRWMSQDPLGLAMGPNSYDYVSNNPTESSDPEGLEGISKITYYRGEAVRPRIDHDNGVLDKYEMRDSTFVERLKYSAWFFAALKALELCPELQDAVLNYLHFLRASGSDRSFNYDRYIASDKAGAKTLEKMIRQAQIWAQRLANGKAGEFEMTSSAVEADDYPETENWQKALGGHSLWGSAKVTATVGSDGKKHFTMRFVLHAEDRYNFNPGEQDVAMGIADAENGVFEVTGLAKQFTQYGESTRVVEWTEGKFESTKTEGGGRTRR